MDGCWILTPEGNGYSKKHSLKHSFLLIRNTEEHDVATISEENFWEP